MREPLNKLKTIASKRAGFAYPLVVAIFGLSLLMIPLIAMAVPGVPYDVNVNRSSASNTALTVSWSNSGLGGVGAGNRVWANGSLMTSFPTVAPNVTYKATGLAAGTNYNFKIGAYDSTGYSDWSFPAAAITKTSASATSFQLPHASFYDSTNMCAACHSVHKARTKYRALKYRYTQATLAYSLIASTSYYEPGVNICFDCHDGSGANNDIKSKYEGDKNAAGHRTKTPATYTTGWFGSDSEKVTVATDYQLPCMTCHDAHVSSKGNYKMLADDLVDYARTTNNANSWSATGAWSSETGISSDAAVIGVIDVGNNPAEKCAVCHHGTKTDKNMIVKGIDLYAMGSPPSTDCTNAGCHNDPHALVGGGEASSAVDSCNTCHPVLVARMMSTAFVSRHYIATDTGNVAQDPDTCTGKCHNNHPRNPNTHAANVWVDATTKTNTAATDYNAATGEGLCLSCHKTQQTSNRPGGTSNSTAYVSPINTSSFQQSAHNYFSTDFGPAHFPAGNKFSGNCIKCHRDNSDDQYSQWGPHASSNRSLLVLPTSGQGLGPGYEEQLCFRCHSNTGVSGGKETFWANRSMATVAWKISQAFGQTYNHPIKSSAIAGRHKATEGYTQSWQTGWMTQTNRHVECQDCHNPHQATQGYNYSGTLPGITASPNPTSSLETPFKGSISNQLKGVWGVYPTTAWNSIPTAASYTTSYNSLSPNGRLFWTGSITKQYMLCLKCHSAYAYGTAAASRPALPSGAPGDSLNRQSDILAEFNPNNYGYHPVFSIGRNQPTLGANPNWRGAYGRNSAAYGPGAGNLPGLTTTFVPPWGGSSLVTCSDCHGNQSTSYSRGYYTAAAASVNADDAPRGPHGSANKWILRGFDRSIRYTLNNGSVFSYNGITNSDKYFCLNCHRADVYGYEATAVTANPGPGLLSRPGQHPPGDTGRTVNGSYNTWGISCRTCHMGRNIGAVHGSSVGKEAGGPGTTYSSKRMLNGAAWLGTGRTTTATAGTCYVRADANSVSTCTQGHNGNQPYARVATYNYQEGAD